MGLGALLMFGFVERLLSRDHKVAQERDKKLWEAVEGRVKKLITAELSGIRTGIINATNTGTAGFAAVHLAQVDQFGSGLPSRNCA